MRLLIVGILRGELITAAKIARERGASVSQVEGVEAALSHIRQGKGADLAMIDVNLNIRALVQGLADEHISLPVIACGTSQDKRIAVAAIEAGAKEYIPLPPDPDLIATVLEAVAGATSSLIFRDESMEKVIKFAQQIAPSDASVLITGESGVGKEVMAHFLHEKSKRSSRPFVSVNCAAIPDNLLESELFGHEKGAFTGAISRRIGKFEEADGGTLLLDEISEMEVRLQAKLLRAIQERVIDRVGGSKPVPVNIRIIATSNRNLAESVKAGEFREDLLYRLNVVTLKIPPLRERTKDIMELSYHFIKRYSDLNGLPLRTLSNDAKRILLSNPWRGNVRELENTMHRAVLLAKGSEIGSEAIITPEGNVILQGTSEHTVRKAAEVAEAATRALVGRTVSDVERELILDTLDHCLGNRTHAAKILGISIRTLRNKLNEYIAGGVNVPEPGVARINSL